MYNLFFDRPLDDAPAHYLLGKAGLGDGFHQAFTLYTGQFHRAVKKGDAELLALVEKGFAAIPTMRQAMLKQKWTGYRLRDDLAAFAVLWLPELAMVGSGLLLLLIFNGVLRRRVAERTAELGEERSKLAELVVQQQQAAQRLSESESLFRAFFEQAAVGVAHMETATGRFLRINPRFCEILGISEEEATRANFMAITHPDDLAASLDNIQRLISGEVRKYCLEKRYIRPDGKTVWVSLEVSALWAVGGGTHSHLAIVQDITPRKLAESRLLQEQSRTLGLLKEADQSRHVLLSLLEDQKSSEEQIRKLFLAVEQNPESVVITDLDPKIEYVNEAFVRNTGYSREEVIGKNPNFLKSGRTSPEIFRQLWETLATGESWRGEFYNRRKNGEEFIG